MSNRRFFRSVLTTEPPLDPQEHVDTELWKQWRCKEMGRQRNRYENDEYERYLYEKNMDEEELINTWRMYDAADQMENSLLEMEGK